jgi:hypothetical protein
MADVEMKDAPVVDKKKTRVSEAAPIDSKKPRFEVKKACCRNTR